MDKCKICAYNDDFMVCDCCIHAPELEDKFKPMTNAQKIREMDDAELMGLLCTHKCECCRFLGNDGGCGLSDWLKDPVEEA